MIRCGHLKMACKHAAPPTKQAPTDPGYRQGRCRRLSQLLPSGHGMSLSLCKCHSIYLKNSGSEHRLQTPNASNQSQSDWARGSHIPSISHSFPESWGTQAESSVLRKHPICG